MLHTELLNQLVAQAMPGFQVSGDFGIQQSVFGPLLGERRSLRVFGGVVTALDVQGFLGRIAATGVRGIRNETDGFQRDGGLLQGRPGGRNVITDIQAGGIALLILGGDDV